MGKNTNRRPQTPKSRNEPFMRAMQEVRRSSAAAPHKLGTDYRRKPKHPKREEY